MIFNNLYKMLRFAGLLLICTMLTLNVSAQAQKEKKVRQKAEVTIKVVDEAGNPLPSAQVVIGEGVIHAVTDATGSYSFSGYPDDFVTVTAPSFEKSVSVVIDLIKANTITLKRAKLFATSADNVLLPFTSVKRRNMTGSTVVIPGSRLDMYPSTDLRNAFTGLANGVEIRETNGSPGVSPQESLGSFGAQEKIAITSRGRTMMVLIDNMPADLTEINLDPSEIESVSFIKDITAKAMFGPAAADGAIFITTKRGQKNEHSTNINYEQGLSTVDRFPGYVSGGDYARLNNQARLNDGLKTNFSDDAIARYDLNDPWDKYYPSVNFRDMILKDTKNFRRANISSSGGNDIVQYYAYLGYNGEGDIYKIGPTADYNRVSTRSNIDIKVNDYVKIAFDFYGGLSFRRSPNYGYDSDFTSENTDSNPVLSLVEFNPMLNDISDIPPVAFPVYASYDSLSKVPWYGVSQAYGTNPIAGIESQGYYSENGRNGSTNIAIDFDMGHIIPGLKSRTAANFNVYNLVRIGKAEDYIAYIASPSVSPKTGNDTINLTKSHLGVEQADMAKLMDYYYQRFGMYENLNYERQIGNDALKASLTYFLSKTARNGIEEPERQQNAIFTGSYTINDKYSILGVANYAGTYSFAKGKRYAMFPSLGASWVISEEGFMSNLKFVNFLKLRAQAGILGNETFLSPFYYVDRWSVNNSGSAFGPISSGSWQASTTDANVQRASIQRIGNPNLTWEKAKEFSAGIDALLFNNRLSLDVTYYNNVRDGQIIRVANTLPYFTGVSGDARPWYNYNKTQYYGVETGLQFTQRTGGVTYSFGGSATVQNSKRLKYDELNYHESYQLRTGKPVDAYFGQTYLGRFSSDEEALAVPQLFDAKLKAGDLKYKDMNGDGIIDESDQSMIGHTDPRLYYSVNATVKFKNFDLTLVGTGRALYDLALTNEYFWNGWGDENYSDYVLRNYESGNYPRLTYYKVNNNFVNSKFWMVDGGFFKLQNAELGYNLPEKVSQIIGARLVRIYARGANLLTVTKVKDIDPESASSGVDRYPLFRTFTGGIKLNF
jgi:TonB-linked SusC/RagA family outer membrane protein